MTTTQSQISDILASAPSETPLYENMATVAEKLCLHADTLRKSLYSHKVSHSAVNGLLCDISRAVYCLTAQADAIGALSDLKQVLAPTPADDTDDNPFS